MAIGMALNKPCGLGTSTCLVLPIAVGQEVVKRARDAKKPRISFPNDHVEDV